MQHYVRKVVKMVGNVCSRINASVHLTFPEKTVKYQVKHIKYRKRYIFKFIFFLIYGILIIVNVIEKETHDHKVSL